MNAAALFQGTNTEGGRTLSQKEFLGYHAWVFKTFVDTDKDGFMSQEEWTSIMSESRLIENLERRSRFLSRFTTTQWQCAVFVVLQDGGAACLLQND